MGAPKGNQGIYKIVSPKKRIYIGQSVDIKSRFAKYRLGHCEGQKRLYASFLKYGVKNHSFEIIENCEINELNIRERYYQNLYDVLSNNGLNCKLTDTNLEKGRHSEETKLKISKSHLGKKLSISHINKLKQAKQNISEETRNKIRLFNIGKHCSDETKEKMRKRMIGNQYTKGIVPVNARKVYDIESKTIYDSITIAAIFYGIKPRTLTAMLDGQNKNKTNLKLLVS